MATITYKCPSCGSSLTFDGNAKEMACSSCGSQFEVEALKQAIEIEKESENFNEGTNWQAKDEGFSDEELNRTRTFNCSSCGAELITDETTVATECAFCGSPSIIPAQFTPGTRPDSVIPFKVSKDRAVELFKNYFKNKKLIPNLFKKNNQIDEIRKLYVPYWLFSCTADADITYSAKRVRSFRRGNYRITQTRHYRIRRAGTVDFKDLPVDASEKTDNKLTESLEPYNTKDALPYVPEVLSGAQASRADVAIEDSKKRADERIARSMQNELRSTVLGYESVVPISTKINVPDGTCYPALYPMWLITTKKADKTYTFAINGQTEQLTCDIPMSVPKAIGWFLGIFAGSSAIITFIMSLILQFR
ncbi:MAG TPA: hypothetical protein GXZ91_04500 [Christensenellaceae bacterium]|nr:hypothetical protein [Christensenellaceae bacterium]